MADELEKRAGPAWYEAAVALLAREDSFGAADEAELREALQGAVDAFNQGAFSMLIGGPVDNAQIEIDHLHAFADSLGVPMAPLPIGAHPVGRLWYRLGVLGECFRQSNARPMPEADPGAEESALRTVAFELANVLGIDEAEDPWDTIGVAISLLRQHPAATTDDHSQTTVRRVAPGGRVTVADALKPGSIDPWQADAPRPHDPTQWHPPSERPMESADVEIEQGNAGGGPVKGYLTGTALMVTAPNGQSQFAVVTSDDKVIPWHPANIKRWRFAQE